MPSFVSDSFTDTAGINITAHTGETGATWTEHPSITASNFVITDANRVRHVADDATVMVYASGVPLSANYTVEVDLVMLSSNGTGLFYGIVGRLSTTVNTRYSFLLIRDASPRVELVRSISGVDTVLGTVSQTVSNNTTYRLELLVGPVLQVRLDNVLLLESTDQSIVASGRAGLIGFAGAGSISNTIGPHVDNFLATDVGWFLLSPM